MSWNSFVSAGNWLWEDWLIMVILNLDGIFRSNDRDFANNFSKLDLILEIL